jgi:hypothetical protein
MLNDVVTTLAILVSRRELVNFCKLQSCTKSIYLYNEWYENVRGPTLRNLKVNFVHCECLSNGGSFLKIRCGLLVYVPFISHVICCQS